MQIKISAIDLLKLTEEELLFFFGFVINVLEVDPFLVKSIKKRAILNKLNTYECTSENMNKIKLSIINKLKIA
jgi:hypothetical protein